MAQAASPKDRIVAVAAELFAERGYHGVSIYDLGAGMGTSGAALYKHFPSKEALLGTMLVGISQQLLDGAHERVATVSTGEASEVLAALIRWHVEFAISQPALITVQTRDFANLAQADRRRVRELQRRYLQLWQTAIQTAVGGSDTQTKSAAHAVFGMINSTPHIAPTSRSQTYAMLERMATAAIQAACGKAN